MDGNILPRCIGEDFVCGTSNRIRAGRRGKEIFRHHISPHSQICSNVLFSLHQLHYLCSLDISLDPKLDGKLLVVGCRKVSLDMAQQDPPLYLHLEICLQIVF